MRLTVLAMFLSACATNTQPPPVIEESSEAPIERSDTASSSTRENKTGRATQTLLAQAGTAAGQSDHETAVLLLERAIRLEPRNPEIWTRLARAHLATDNFAAAQQHARKAIALAGNNYPLERMAWLTYADILQASGKQAEARDIRRRYSRARG